jgi:predicted DNA-binding mobile mystery protein A
MKETPVRLLAVDQLDRRLPRLRKAAEEIVAQAPRTGWVRAIRSALGMSEGAFAKRLGGSQGAIQELERNEVSGVVTLESLRRAAHALDADLVYALVPRKPLRAMISARARAVAEERLGAVARSMAMEGQSLSAQQFKSQLGELAGVLENKPRELWR